MHAVSERLCHDVKHRLARGPDRRPTWEGRCLRCLRWLRGRTRIRCGAGARQAVSWPPRCVSGNSGTVAARRKHSTRGTPFHREGLRARARHVARASSSRATSPVCQPRPALSYAARAVLVRQNGRSSLHRLQRPGGRLRLMRRQQSLALRLRLAPRAVQPAASCAA